jgi:micrococcal nuclease
MLPRKIERLIVFAILFLLVNFISQKFPQFSNPPNPSISPTPSVAPSPVLGSTSQLYKVTKVVDGDTIHIEGGQTVRLIGIDTPETVDPRRPVQCFGKEASDKAKELLLNKQVTLEKDISETDRYGRLLRYVYLFDATNSAQTVFINEALVKEGYAYASAYPPDIKYQEQLQKAQKEARENRRGLWSMCDIVNP